MAAMARIAFGVVVLAVAAVLAVAPAQARQDTTAKGAIAVQTSRALGDILASLATHSGRGDLNYLADGVWHGNDSGYWFCNVGAGTAAAVLWHTGGERDASLRSLALRTFDEAIAAHRNANGSFGPRDGRDIETTSFGVQLGTAYIELADSLSPAHRARWQSSMAGAADFLVRNGNLTWYTNGNINLSQVEFFYLVWRATGEARFKQAYEQAWQFTLNPPQSRWPGFGLHITGRSFPARLGADSQLRGYLAESGGGKPGFDADYTVLQLDAAAALYLFSGDPRAKLLSNLLANTLVHRTNGRSVLDTSSGTRHPQRNRFIPLLTSGLAILGVSGARHNLATPLPAQLRTVISTYRSALSYGYSPYLYRGLGTQLSMILLAESQATEIAEVPGLPGGAAAQSRVMPAHSDFASVLIQTALLRTGRIEQ
jgi:hypothetical protein